MSSQYLDLVYTGRNQWWRYLAGVLLIVGLWFGTAVATYRALGMLAQMARHTSDLALRRAIEAIMADPFTEYVAINLGHIAILLGLILTVCLIHKRRFISLITHAHSVRWKRIGWGFAVYFILAAVLTALDYAVYPSVYRATAHPFRVLIHAPAVMVLTPLQATAEEMLFRGYLMQGAGLITRRFWFPAVLTSAIFMTLHLANPEVEHGAIAACTYYFGIAFLLAFITIRSNSLELAIGAHAAINLFSALLVNYSDSALAVESFFFSTELHLGANLAALGVMAVVSYVFFFTSLRPSSLAAHASTEVDRV